MDQCAVPKARATKSVSSRSVRGRFIALKRSPGELLDRLVALRRSHIRALEVPRPEAMSV